MRLQKLRCKGLIIHYAIINKMLHPEGITAHNLTDAFDFISSSHRHRICDRGSYQRFHIYIESSKIELYE